MTLHDLFIPTLSLLLINVILIAKYVFLKKELSNYIKSKVDLQIEGNLFRRHQEQSSLNISILSRLNGIQEILDKQIESNKISLELFEKNDARNSVFEIVLDAMCDNLLELNKRFEHEQEDKKYDSVSDALNIISTIKKQFYKKDDEFQEEYDEQLSLTIQLEEILLANFKLTDRLSDVDLSKLKFKNKRKIKEYFQTFKNYYFDEK